MSKSQTNLKICLAEWVHPWDIPDIIALITDIIGKCPRYVVYGYRRHRGPQPILSLASINKKDAQAIFEAFSREIGNGFILGIKRNRTFGIPSIEPDYDKIAKETPIGKAYVWAVLSIKKSSEVMTEEALEEVSQTPDWELASPIERLGIKI